MSPDINMSFLYDEQILKEFSKLLEPKTAQQAPQQAFTPAQMQDVALKLLNNIKTSYSPIEVPNNAQLFSRNAQNLNELTTWMLNNKVSYNGHPIVLADKFQLDKTIPYIEINNAPPIYAWKDGLIAFLKDLQNQAKDSGNNLFMQHVSGLISDANNELQAGIAEEAAKPVADKTNKQTQQQGQPTAQQDQGQGQQGQGQGQATEVQKAVYQTKEVLKQNTGSDNINLPFDVDTNQLSISDINDFNRQISFTFRTAIEKNKWGIIYSQIQQISNAINNWNSIATPEAQEGGFELNINTDIDVFINTYANKDFTKARAMLNNLVPLLQGIGNLLKTLLASPVYVSMFGGTDVIENQVSRAQEMIAWSQQMVSRIDTVLKNNARK
jgi:hypothetical protein